MIQISITNHTNPKLSKINLMISKIPQITNHLINKTTYIFHNKKAILQCGDIESNPGPRPNLLTNHPQLHVEKQKTYFYNKTTQIKLEYRHILETFIPYLYHTQTITLAPAPAQCNQLIAENSTQWTISL